MRSGLLVVALWAVLPAAARGQVEITPLAGFRFGGSVSTTAQADIPGASLEVADSAAFGIHVGYPVGGGEIELLYARQDTRLQASELFASVPAFDIALESWQLGGNAVFGEEDARLRPFFGIALGVTRLLPKPAGLSDETRFSGSFGGGVKLWLGRHAGVRLEGRGFFTLLASDSRTFCAEGSCRVFVGDVQVIAQAEFRAGLILRF
jgi:hypothetical protein